MTPYDLFPELAEFDAASDAACAAARDLPAQEAMAALARDGLTGVLAPEEVGGLGLSLAHAYPVLSAAGRHRMTVPLAPALALSHVLPSLPGGLAAKITSGEVILAEALVGDVSCEGDRITGTAGHVIQGGAADFVVIAQDDCLIVAETAGAEVTAAPFADLDPGQGLSRLSFRDQPAVVIDDADAVAEYRARSLLFRCIDVLAGAREAQSLAKTFLMDRDQFGQKLIGFQSLRHHLARSYMELHGIDRLVWDGLSADSAGARLTIARMAFARAATAGPAALEMALHLHGGMGFTWDVPVHLWLRRARVLLGPEGAEAARAAVAEDLLRA